MVIALHPRAQFRALVSWPTDKLGALPALSDSLRCVVISGLSQSGIERLVTNYLSNVRTRPGTGFAPFSSGALEQVREDSGGRPGDAIRLLHDLVEYAVDQNLSQIGKEQVEELGG